MKRSIFCKFFVLTLALAMSVTGCKKTTKNPTPIPAGGRGPVSNPGPNPPIGLGQGGGVDNVVGPKGVNDPTAGGGGIPLPTGDIDGMIPNAEIFKGDTVYFEFDRATVKASEKSKLEHVGSALKGTAANKLLVEGHCDERGTEEYNRSLGERRALALREYLINYGISADRIITRSYGEDRPATQGHDEAAWSKNRRGEFILLTPKN